MNYAAIAAERYPHATILGTDGRYAVVAQNGRVVYLALTEQQQKNIALGVDSPVLLNLHPVDFDKIRDVYDPEEARRERRENREGKNLMRFR